MSIQDPIAQLITIINNAQKAGKRQASVRFSNIKQHICRILKEEGYIANYSVSEQDTRRSLTVFLKYVNGAPAIRIFKRVSKSSCRKYSGVSEFPSVMNGLGILIVSTSNGVCTTEEAKKLNVGGELLCQVF